VALHDAVETVPEIYNSLTQEDVMKPSRLAMVASLVVCLVAPALAEKAPLADRFEGVFISMNAPGAMGSRVEIWIDAYTSDDVAAQLVGLLEQKGQQDVLNQVTKLQAGRLQIGTSNAYPIAVARQRANDDGSRTVFLVSSRPFAGFEPRTGTRIEDYPFGIIELKLDATGKGEGQIIGAAQLSFDPATKHLNIASYAVEPGRLSEVKDTLDKEKEKK